MVSSKTKTLRFIIKVCDIISICKHIFLFFPEFCGLRSKVYSFLCNGKAVKRLKGLAKVTVEKELKHEHYKRALFDENSMISSMDCIRSHKHDIYVETIQKRGLCCYDDKRWLKDAFTSYSYGNYNIALQTSNNSAINSVACDGVTNDNEPMSIEVYNDEKAFKNAGLEGQDINEFEMSSEEQVEWVNDGHTFEINGFQVTRCIRTKDIN